MNTCSAMNADRISVKKRKLWDRIGGDNTIKIHDIDGGTERIRFEGHKGSVTCLAYSKDGKVMATGSTDRTIKLWDTATGQNYRTLQGHTEEVRSIAFRPDGTELASGSVDHTVQVWQAY